MSRFLNIAAVLVFTLIWPPLLAAAPVIALSLRNSRPHEASSYTQGLFFHDGRLYESSGLYGRSAFSAWSCEPGRPFELLRRLPLPNKYFAEGAAAADGEIYLLTWQERTGFVLDPATLLVKREFSYSGEGWGLTWDGRRLWRSDGSARLYPHRTGDFAPDGEPLTVTDEGREVPLLNELEWDPRTGLILANLYGRDLVAAIDPATGQVRFWLDARPLRDLARQAGLTTDPARPLDTALNGLALDGESLWLTGKLWPRLYQVVWPPEGMADEAVSPAPTEDQGAPGPAE